MRVVVHILIYHPSESLGPGGLRRGVCPAQVLSSVRDLAALRGDIGVDPSNQFSKSPKNKNSQRIMWFIPHNTLAI